MPEAKITVYGAPWCPDCKRSKQFLGEQRVPYNLGSILVGAYQRLRRRLV